MKCHPMPLTVRAEASSKVNKDPTSYLTNVRVLRQWQSGIMALTSLNAAPGPNAAAGTIYLLQVKLFAENRRYDRLTNK